MTRTAKTVPPGMLLHPVDMLALGFGSGLVPIGPGTAGTLVAVPLYLILQTLSLPIYLVCVAVAFVAGIGICAHAARCLVCTTTLALSGMKSSVT